MTRRLWVVSEVSLIGLLVDVLLGRRPLVLAVEAYLPPLAGRMEALVARLAAAGRLVPAAQAFPDMAALIRNPNLASVEDIFADLEPWQNRRFAFARSGDGPYGMAFRQVAGKYFQDRYVALMFMDAARQAGPISPSGCPRDVADLDAARAGQPPDGRRPWTVAALLVNLMITAAAICASWVWIIRRCRATVTPQPCFMAADYLEDPRDCALYAEAEEGGPVLLVKRTPAMDPAKVPCGGRYRVCEADDGLFTPLAALAAAGMALADGLTILGRWGWASPALFWALAALPNKRVRLRAWCCRFRPRFFWARDEYNVEHILRTQELHRIGARQLGLMHGTMPLADINPRRRYIHMDVFYVFGLHLVDKVYRDTWAPSMRVVAVGSFGFTRERLAAGPDADADAITIFGSNCLHRAELPETVRAVAAAFPQYKVVFKPKMGRTDPRLAPLAEAAGVGTANISLSLDDAGHLMARSRYVVADPSTVVAEAIHLGVPGLMLDITPNHRTCLYREFPFICQPGVLAVVDQLKAFEDGRARFDRARYDRLVDVSGRHFLDFIRDDLGLAPRPSARPEG